MTGGEIVVLLTRRNLLQACGVAGAAALLPVGGAVAAPDDWLGWLRAHPGDACVVLDDGRGGRVAHRAHERQPLAAVRHVVHLAAYRRSAVAAGERVCVGEWERYHLGLDGGAHQAALRALGLPSSNGVRADDPRRFVAVGDLVSVMVEHGDFAAGDWLRRRVGVAGPAFGDEVLRLVLGRPVGVERYVDDPRLRLEVLGRFPDVPRTDEGLRSWALGTWAGTAAEVGRACRGLDGAVVGVLPGVVAVGVGVRWEDGREGVAAVLARGVDEAWAGRARELAGLVRTALAEPAVLRGFHVGLS
ncbi:twin-arginine translocation signal domain-containing protein [Actinosynnema sp. NPDC053489]|uniref:twin-arginine translocation signal domain-containing protein n=1 Tax=Actinosynnema sp. NPDC053489 TaxID=3363916 RepID=UPI0037CA67B0